MLRLIATAVALVLLVACAGPAPRTAIDDTPLLRLAPAALGGTLALQQRLAFEHGGRSEIVDALVEADARSVRVVIHGQGQVALRLAWDGQELTQTRAEWLPPQLSAERVLSDLQLVFWPAPAVSAALPPGWRLVQQGTARELRHGDELVIRIENPAPDRHVLHQLRTGYRLGIHSVPVTP